LSGRPRIRSTVRARREQAGLSQAALAAAIGTSRQTLAAIEAGRTTPGTALALRLASALGRRVEDLFHLDRPAQQVSARLAGPLPHDREPSRVRLAVVGGRMIAVPLAGTLSTVTSLTQADGVICGRRGTDVEIRLLAPPGRLAETVVVAGCDPALSLIAGEMHRSYSRCGLAWLPAGSLRALQWLRDGAAHVAGLHVRDARTGQDNVPFVRRLMRGRRAVVLGFATWEQGLILAPGNPRGIHHVADLARPAVTVINRELGSGARRLLDAALAEHRIDRKRIRGYGREAPTHLAVAQAVALGLVDAGIGIRAAARAFGLDFIPIQRERYDLVVPAPFLNLPAVQAFLDSARSVRVRAELEAVGEYDTARMGDILAELP
jgi:putative molybdopterin biosynthesis protein